MDAVTTHTGRAVPLRRSNVDTDQIIPAVYLKRITKTGFEDGLFRAWRDSDPGFVLNDSRYDGASVLIAGAEFGTGSSREHAVWALRDYGFRAVIAPSFGDIFRGNALKEGLVPIELPLDSVEKLWHAVEADPSTRVTVDVERRSVAAGGDEFFFPLDDFSQLRLLEGLDDIDLTNRHVAEIGAYENGRASFWPVVTLA
ncbi:MAG TPA: 3-isopropylmalate dehydratase small subunit [Micromonosporaceae bacterium]|jgi:3-isopropylmalate/(R)-2-methylmalate dehydratase small subunit